ncbi:MAG TPA: hypothetical protein VMW35_20295 [Myxococcota bacterium]|jgi:hypothetical protein|nr:hypothetical protein [Myxococcota bacterium]
MDRTASIRLVLALGVALFVGFGGSVGCSTTAMVHPAAVPSARPMAQNREIITQALSRRAWIVDSDKPGEIMAHYQRRGAVAHVRITYDKSSILIAYAGSENLKCQPSGDECSTIHKTYNTWVTNLYQDISLSAQNRR